MIAKKGLVHHEQSVRACAHACSLQPKISQGNLQRLIASQCQKDVGYLLVAKPVAFETT
jgi:hypothetical protein